MLQSLESARQNIFLSNLIILQVGDTPLVVARRYNNSSLAEFLEDEIQATYGEAAAAMIKESYSAAISPGAVSPVSGLPASTSEYDWDMYENGSPSNSPLPKKKKGLSRVLTAGSTAFKKDSRDLEGSREPNSHENTADKSVAEVGFNKISSSILLHSDTISLLTLSC